MNPYFFLIIRLKNSTLMQKKMASPSVAACSLTSPGPSISFIFHYNNLQTILACSLPSYLTLVFVFSILPFFFHKCLCFMSSILEILSRNNCWVLGEHAHQRAEKYNCILWTWQRLASISGHESGRKRVWILYIKLYLAFHGREWTGNYLK